VRTHDPFQPDDLRELGEFYERAVAVVPMEDIYDHHTWNVVGPPGKPLVLGLRHDCDNVIAPAVHMARWEADHGYRSTYYVLHSAPYWQDKPTLQAALEVIASCGHEIGIHNDAITVALQTGRDAGEVLNEATEELRSYGHRIRSTVAHGHALCGVKRYVNDELFRECYRSDYGDVARLSVAPYRLADFGLDFDANWLPRGDYLSDSGGRWSQRFEDVAAAWPSKGQLHLLVHPDWWEHAFTREKAAA
jgi:hypothetical protein